MRNMFWIIFIVLFSLFCHKLIYFRSDLHRIPGPWPLPLIGSALSVTITAEGVIPTVQRFQKKFGDIFVLWVGLVPAVNVITAKGAEALLSNKNNLKKGRAYNLLEPWLGQGLLTSDGGRWFSHRRLITPTFHFSILDTFLDIFQEHGKILVERLSQAAQHGTPIEIQPFITRCTLDIIGEAAMGIKFGAQNITDEEENSTSQYIKSIFRISRLTAMRILTPLLRASPIFFRTKMGISYTRQLDIIHRFAKNVIKARKSAPLKSRSQKRLAFLDLLLEARDEDGQPLSEEDIREEVDTFMFEGHDTTAAALVWVLYLLAKHPEIQEDIYREIQEILPEDAVFTTEMLSNMKTMERSIKEALRLYPSVPNVVTIVEDIKIEEYIIPKGSSLILHIYQLHRDPHTFPDPEQFDPDRFLPENSSKRHPYSYIPFSAGPRNCIGQKFAMLEEKVVLAQILRAYEVKLCGELDESKIRSELILRPPKGLQLLFRPRT